MSEHRCQLPERSKVSSTWRCPKCFRRFVWSKRMINREVLEYWTPMRDDMETRRMRSDAEFNRFGRTAFTVAVVFFVVIVGLIVWIVLRLT